jgi:hypothetical protein
MNPTNSHKGMVLGAALWVMSALMAFGAGPSVSREGVALVVLYDTSGSMRETVRDRNGQESPKYVIANRALEKILDRLETYSKAAPEGAPRKIDAGLIVFNKGKGYFAVPFGDFKPQPFRDWIGHYKGPDGNTPLGNSLTLAAQTLIRSPLTRKHILVITDGMNTIGPNPEAVLPKLKAEAERANTAFQTHLIAFDVAAAVFNPLKKQGATVVSASDEVQLEAQLTYIFEKKILLEDEEPPAKAAPKPTTTN